MGDALAIALLKARGFGEADFARSHPGGALGRRLLLHVSDIMHSGAEMPVIGAGATLAEALVEMSQKGLGVTAIVDEQARVRGIFTDGDLRRALDADIDIKTCRAAEVMTKAARHIAPGALAASALAQMEAHSINALLVLDAEGKLVGVLNMHDLLKARVV